MNRRFMKLVSSCVMAGILTCTGVAAQAAEVVDTEYADTLSIGNCATNIKNIYKANYPEKAEMIDEIVDTLSRDEVFTDIFESEGATAFQIIEDSLQDALEPSISTFSTRSVSYNLPTCVIDQCYPYYCGPASAIQALVSSGKISRPSNTESAVKQAAQEMGSDRNGTYISQIPGYMNKYEASSTVKYKAKAFTRYTYDKALDFVIYSLANGRAPVMYVYDSKLLGYYDNSFTYYVTIVGVDTGAGTVTICDSSNNTAYRGVHKITIDTFNSLMKGNLSTKDGWLVVYSNTSDGFYTYE